MFREQTFDVVYTPAPDRRDWPSFDDFHYPEEIHKWRDIQTGIYKILEYFDQGRNRYGPSVVLKLENENRSIVFVCLLLLWFLLSKKEKKPNSSGISVLKYLRLTIHFWILRFVNLHINMLVCFHLFAFLVNDYLTPEWQKEVRYISREVIDALFEADDR